VDISICIENAKSYEHAWHRDVSAGDRAPERSLPSLWPRNGSRDAGGVPCAAGGAAVRVLWVAQQLGVSSLQGWRAHCPPAAVPSPPAHAPAPWNRLWYESSHPRPSVAKSGTYKDLRRVLAVTVPLCHECHGRRKGTGTRPAPRAPGPPPTSVRRSSASLRAVVNTLWREDTCSRCTTGRGRGRASARKSDPCGHEVRMRRKRYFGAYRLGTTRQCR